jgi:hypothetical protein
MPLQNPAIDPYAAIATPIASSDPYANIAEPLDAQAAQNNMTPPTAEGPAQKPGIWQTLNTPITQMTATGQAEGRKLDDLQGGPTSMADLQWRNEHPIQDVARQYLAGVEQRASDLGTPIGLGMAALSGGASNLLSKVPLVSKLLPAAKVAVPALFGAQGAGQLYHAATDSDMDPDARMREALAGGAGLTGGAAGLGSSPAAAAAQEWAKGNPDEAALRGLGISAKSPKGLATLGNLSKVRPYLQAASSRLDLQERIPGAKGEIWDPMQSTLAQIGDKRISGPDGPTTVRDLEALRKQTSAQLDSLRSKDPMAIQTAIQKGQSEADLSAYYKRILGSLDPHLQAAGIDPAAIRDTYGAVKGIEKQVAGKTTLAEKPQPYGFGRMANVSLANPHTWLGEPLQGARDLVAGRPLWSGKPTDINIREGFRVGGAKPDFRSPVRPNYMQPPLQLEANVPGNAGYGADSSQGGFAGRPPITPAAPQSLYSLPAKAAEAEVQPMVGVLKNQHPGAAADFSRERINPAIFKPPIQVPQTPAGFAVAPDGTVVRLPKAFLQPPTKAKVTRKTLYDK